MKARLTFVPIPCPCSALPLFRSGWHLLLPLLLLMAMVGPRASAQPANDDFANAESISGYGGSIAGSNVGGTRELDEPEHGLNPGVASIWYVWRAPVSGTAIFSTITSAFDTTLGIY